jgi:hypothetical protein
VLEAMQRRLDRTPAGGEAEASDGGASVRYVEGVVGATHFLTKALPRVRTEMSPLLEDASPCPIYAGNG